MTPGASTLPRPSARVSARAGLRSALLAAALPAALLLAACGDGNLASGNGGGMETTNGITARIRLPDGSAGAGAQVKIRRADFITGGAAPSSRLGRDTLTDSAGRFVVRGLEAGAYTVEVHAPSAVEASNNSGSGLAWVAQNLRMDVKDSLLDLGTHSLAGTGSLRGVVHMANLPPGNRLRLGIYGLDRQVEPRPDGGYAFEGLAPASYELLVFSDSLMVTGTAALFASVHPQGETSLDSVFLPMDFRSDSLAIAGYLKRQGILDFDWSTRTSAYTNRIRTLRLTGLGLTHLDPSIGRLFFINSLHLDNNPLAALPDSLRRMGLFVLSLDSVPLAALPPQVLEQTRLRQLSLAHTGLKVLPAGLASLASLTSLDLEGNSLDTLPPVLPSLTGLTVLRIGQNPLGSLPDGLAALTRLEQLYVAGAVLDSLPSWLTTLPDLQVLHAFNNRLAALPDSMGRLANLKVLALGRNQLTTLPASLGACARLSALRLADNPITSLPSSLTALSPSDLDVTGNSLCDVSPDLAAWLERLSPGWKAKQKGCP